MFRPLFFAVALALLSAPVQAQQRAVAVTFDDPPYQATEAELCDPVRAMALTRDFVAMLRPLDTRATVFVNEGKVCEERRADLLPALLNMWLDAGLDMGNHTFSHLNIHRTTVEAYLADVDAGAPVTRAVLAERGGTLRFFRHPFLFTGETPEKKAAIAAGLTGRGYTVAPVTIDNNDWMFAALYRRAEAAGDEALKTRIGEAYVAHMAAVLDHWEPYSAELTGGREPAQVLLLHAHTLNRDWYPRIHALYLARGYRFVTLDEALADPIYGHADDYVRANGVSWLHRWTFTEGRPIRWEPDPPKWIMDAYEALN
ncbi:peptidoglycan/xylan/chitin deacetylase (PgdA/CDA1 family) [Brevundimonas alba]|uniref:Chitooligosaccharide deacetylase n=1 Tax=Brevundimonas alba TaxID=74314 RepID=A0A7X5YJZ5_9CAUL|nr:polysaccharide deacetylase family protein [Brevundimonas alba]NJC40997.1 peptidoglycan/xylan/chitin deacetylase (PgdA/CDA1 family) [Brevundimonas alba]